MELEKVSRLLGHANLGQTLAYAEIIREDLYRSARKHEDTFIGPPGARTDGRPRELVRCPGPSELHPLRSTFEPRFDLLENGQPWGFAFGAKTTPCQCLTRGRCYWRRGSGSAGSGTTSGVSRH